MGLVMAIYFVIYVALPKVPSAFVGTYVLRPILWGLLAYAVLLLPRYRAAGRLRLRNLLIKSAPAVAGFQISLSLIAGLFGGFGRSPYSFTPQGIITNLVFVGSALLGIELSRAWLINRFARRNTTLILGLATLLYTTIMIPPGRFTGLGGAEETIKFLGSTGLPLLAQNLLASFLAFLGGPLASIAYRGTLQAFEWFCPILPYLPDHIKALVGTIAPVIGFLIVQSLYSTQARPGARRRAEREGSFAGWIAVSIVGVLMIWFSLGLFPLLPTVVYSGSMRPTMDVGDVVIVARVPADVVKEGDIIQFILETGPTVHRVVEISESEGSKVFIVKGDANPGPDLDPIVPEQVVGKVAFTIPKIGWASIATKQMIYDIWRADVAITPDS